MSDSKSSGSICSSTQTLTSSSTNSCCRCFGMLVRMMDSTGRQSLRRRRMNRAPQMHPITDAVSITYHVSDDNLFDNFFFWHRNFLLCVYCYTSIYCFPYPTCCSESVGSSLMPPVVKHAMQYIPTATITPDTMATEAAMLKSLADS